MKEKVTELLKKCTGDHSPTESGHELQFHCPLCRHHKQKLGVVVEPEDDKFGWWHCWVCDAGGKGLSSLFKEAGTEKLGAEFRKLVGGSQNWQKIKTSLQFFEDKEEKPPRAELPKSYVKLWKSSSSLAKRATAYLKERGLTSDDVFRYELGVAKEGKYGGRLIVPSFGADMIPNYFVARSLFGRQKIKYLNPSVKKSKVLMFESHLDFSMPVVVCEGVFDAISLRFNAVPVLGGSISEVVLASLVQAPKVWVMFDSDAQMKGRKLSLKLRQEGVDSEWVEMPKGADPNSLGYDACWNLIQNKSHEPDPMKIHLQQCFA